MAWSMRGKCSSTCSQTTTSKASDGRLGIARHQVVHDVGSIALGPVERLPFDVGGGNLDVVEIRPRLEVPQQNPRGAADVDNFELAPLSGGLAGPGVDVVRQRVVAGLAQAVKFTPTRIDPEGVAGFGEIEPTGGADLNARHFRFSTSRRRQGSSENLRRKCGGE